MASFLYVKIFSEKFSHICIRKRKIKEKSIMEEITTGLKICPKCRHLMVIKEGKMTCPKCDREKLEEELKSQQKKLEKELSEDL